MLSIELTRKESMEALMRDDAMNGNWVEWLTNLEALWKRDQDDRYLDAVVMLVRGGHRKGLPDVSGATHFLGARGHAHKCEKHLYPAGGPSAPTGEYEFEVTARAETQAWYVAQRLDGATHNMAEALAKAQAPAAMTDREFLEGHCNGNQFDGSEAVGDHYKAVAAAAGVDVKGKIYVGGLALFPGDPKAWVDGRGDIQRVAQERGLNVQGAVTVKSGEREPAPDIDVADDVIDQRVLQKMDADPDITRRPYEEVREEARAEIKPHWCK